MTDAPSSGPGLADMLRMQLEVLELVVDEAPLRTTLGRLCAHLHEMLPGARVRVHSITDTGLLELVCAPKASAQELEAFRGLSPSPTRGAIGLAMHQRAPALVADALEDPCWADLRPLAARFGIRASWALPLEGRERTPCGALVVTRAQPGLPSEHELQLLRAAAQLAAIAFERERTERVTRSQRKLLAGIVDGSEDPIFVKDKERRYILVNAAEVHGVRDSAEEMLGLRDEELYPPGVAEQTRVVDERVLRTGRSALFEQDFDNKIEGVRSFLVRKSPLIDEAGRVVGIVGIARDVTALKRAEASLRQVQKLESLGVLSGGIAHDFNNILTGILGNAELAALEVEPGSKADRHLQEVERGVRRAADLTGQLLAYAGRTERAKRPVALPELLREVEALLGSTLPKRAVRTREFPADLPAIEADPTQIRQVLLNLLANAGEALTGGGGHIHVAARAVELDPDDPLLRRPGLDRMEPGRFVELEVTDDGAGMTPEVLARIFEPFFSTKFAGRGLGLPAVHGIVRGHGGAIWAASEPGHGTTFTVLLPASEHAPAPPSEEAPTSETRGTGTVLVVEDEAVVRRVLDRVLEAAGFTVLSAEDGEQGCEQLLAHGPGVVAVILDLTTPRLSGPEALRRMREQVPDLPVVLVSGYTEQEALAAFDTGEIDAFVRKPFRGAELLEGLSIALSRQAAPE